MIRTGTAAVRGSVSRDVIRRAIRLHSNAIRGAYERRLIQNPTLAGRITVQIVISPSGTVANASVQSSTLDHPGLEQDILNVFRRIRFPTAEGGGVVIVNYPLVFQPSPD